MVYKRLLFILILLFIQDKEKFLFIQDKEKFLFILFSTIKRNFSLFLDPQLQIYWDFFSFFLSIFEFTLPIVKFLYLYSKLLFPSGPRPTTRVLNLNHTRRTADLWTQYCKMFQNKEKFLFIRIKRNFSLSE